MKSSKVSDIWVLGAGAGVYIYGYIHIYIYTIYIYSVSTSTFKSGCLIYIYIWFRYRVSIHHPLGFRDGLVYIITGLDFINLNEISPSKGVFLFSAQVTKLGTGLDEILTP